MNIRIVTVGKLKKAFIAEGVEEYLMRMKRFCSVEIIEVKEDAKLLEKSKGYIIALTPQGKECSSEALAALIKDKTDITFLIGGAEGLPNEILQKADLQLSLSKLTLQHDLAQLVLVEQLYRAFTILKGLPYHK